MTMSKATNIYWHEGTVSKQDRQKLLGQKGVVLWFTGLSGSGKSTIAREVEWRLHEQNYLTYVLDGDNVRFGLNKNLGFSPEDRQENIRRISEVAKLFADAGLITITAFISPYQADRNQARQLLPDGEFVEVYVKCAIAKCEQRDVKGLYQKARQGLIQDFTGVSAPYEAPEYPEVVVNTTEATVEESAQQVLDYLVEKGIIQK